MLIVKRILKAILIKKESFLYLKYRKQTITTNYNNNKELKTICITNTHMNILITIRGHLPICCRINR